MPDFLLFQLCKAYCEFKLYEAEEVAALDFSAKYLTRGESVGIEAIMIPVFVSMMDHRMAFEESR